MPTKKEFEDALRKVQRNQMTHTRSSTQDTDYELARKRFLPNLAQGSAAGFLGTPVDLVNLLTNVKKPVMGSEWIGEKLNADIDSPAFAVGQLLDPTGPVNAATAIAPALGGIIKAAKGAHWYPYSKGGDSVDEALKWIKGDAPDPKYYNDAAWAELPEEIRWSVGGDYEKVAKTHPKEWKEAFKKAHGNTPQYIVNNFIDNQLNKYIHQRLGTENDEIRKLAEHQHIHTNLEPTPGYGLDALARTRKSFGFPEKGVAKNQNAKNWEDRVDLLVKPFEAWQDVKYNPDLPDMYDKSYEDALKIKDEIIDAYSPEQGLIPRLALANPKTPLYEIGDEAPSHLGFDHLTDELFNMVSMGMRPELVEPTWPKDLLLTPEQVETMSVEDMVKKVAKVNQHRAKMAKVAERKSNERLASLPELARSESGYRLVEHGDTSDKNAQDLVRMCGEKNEWCTQGEGLSREYGSGNNRLVNILDPENKPIYQATVTTEEVKRPTDWNMVSKEDMDEVKRLIADEYDNNVPHSEYLRLLKETPSYQAYLANGPRRKITEFKGYRNSTETPPEEQRQMFINWMKENNIQPNLGVANQLGMSKDPITDLYMDNQELINEIYRNDDFMNFMIDRNRNPPDMDDFELISDYHAWWAGYDPDRI